MLLYVTFANMILQAALAPWVEIQSLTWFALDFCLAWFISTVRFLRKKASVDIGFSFGYCRGHIVAAVSF